jgi:hypothetical protein
MTKRSPALVRRLADSASDDEIAESIVGELGLNRSTDKERAISQIKCCFESVRETVTAAGREPRPSKAKETIEQIAKHAEALASCIEKLSPNWRWHLSLSVFNERNDEGVPIIDNRPDVDSDGRARTRMSEWIDHLKRIPDDFGQMQNSRRDFFYGPQALCAFKVRELISALSPATELTTGAGSKFYAITSWVWYAATGEQKSLKRACDANIKLFKQFEEAARHLTPETDRSKNPAVSAAAKSH